jgi:hypothetical protein
MFWVIGLNMQLLFVNDDKGILSVEQKFQTLNIEQEILVI